MRSHGLEVLFRVSYINNELLLIDRTFTVYPIVTRTNTIDKMIADKTVQGIPAVSEILIVLTCIFRIRFIIDLLGIALKVFKIINAMGTIDRVCLYKGCKLEIPMIRIPSLTLFGSTTVIARTIRYFKALASNGGVGIYCISLINVSG